MKEIKLVELELTNYRNIEHEVYAFEGKNAKIMGENRIGKTNTLEAIYFLLTNYLLDGSSDLTALKPLDDTKKVVAVKGTFSIWDNAMPQAQPKTITLEKRYQEKWVKTKGSGELSLDGHTETYFFNDIKQDTARQFYDLLFEHFGFRNDIKKEIDPAQMLCNPLYLGNLGESKDWTNLRSFIIQVIGDVTDEEVYEEEPTTLEIKEDLDKALGKTENVKKLYNNDIKSYQEKIKAYEANIDLLERTPTPSAKDVEKAEKEKQEHEDNIARLQSGIGSNKEVADLVEKVFAIKKAVLEQSTKEFTTFKANLNDPNKAVKEEIEKANADLNEWIEKKITLNNDIRGFSGDEKIANIHIDTCKTQRENLLKDYHSLEEAIRNADSQVQTTCPTCGKPLDEDKVKEAKATYLKGLNEKQEYIVKEGKSVAEELRKYEQLANTAKERIAKANEELAVIDKEIETRKAHIEELKGKMVSSDTPTFVESKELLAMRKNLAEQEELLRLAKEEESQMNTKTAGYIQEEKQALTDLQKIFNEKAYYDKQMEVLEDIRNQLKDAQSNLADVEQKKELLDTFIYTKLHLLDKHVANVFGDIKFQLIKENINGGFDPVCKPYIYNIEKGQSTDVLWKSGSKSEKIVTGIAIAEHIKSHLGLSELPYLFDEGGEISTDTFSTKFKTNAQIICVKVEDNIFKPVVINF